MSKNLGQLLPHVLPILSKSIIEKDEEEATLDEQFEHSLAVFGLNKKRERKSQQRDERKHAKTYT